MTDSPPSPTRVAHRRAPSSMSALRALGAAAGTAVLLLGAPSRGAAQTFVAEGRASIQAGASASFRARIDRRPRRAPPEPPVVASRRGPVRLPAVDAPAVEVPGHAGGPIAIRSLGARCDGFVGPTPNHTLVVDGPRTTVRATVTSGPASVLLLRAPDGRLRCHPVHRGPGRELALVETLPAGRYQLFVGLPSAGVAPRSYMLRVETFTASYRRAAAHGSRGSVVARPGRADPVHWVGPGPDGRRARLRGADLVGRPWTLWVDQRARPLRLVFHRSGRVTGHPRAVTWSWSGRQILVYARDGRSIARLRMIGVRSDGQPTLRGRDRAGRRLVLRPERPRGRATASRW